MSPSEAPEDIDGHGVSDRTLPIEVIGVEHSSSRDQHLGNSFVRSISTPVIVPVDINLVDPQIMNRQQVTVDNRDPGARYTFTNAMESEYQNNKLSESRYDEKGADVAARRHSRKPGMIVRKSVNTYKSREDNNDLHAPQKSVDSRDQKINRKEVNIDSETQI